MTISIDELETITRIAYKKALSDAIKVVDVVSYDIQRKDYKRYDVLCEIRDGIKRLWTTG